MLPLVLMVKEHAQGKGALGVHYGELPCAEGIKSAHDAELTVIVSSEVAECGQQNLHSANCGASLRQRKQIFTLCAVAEGWWL